MARQTTSFIQGRVGNIVFYKRGDQYVSRSAPASVHKTANMEKRTRNFGIASKTGKAIRIALDQPLANERSAQAKFAGAIAKWLGVQDITKIAAGWQIWPLANFSFSTSTCFGERFKKKLSIELSSPERVTINIPAFEPLVDIVSPAAASEAVMVITTVVCNMADYSAQKYHWEKIIPFNTVVPGETLMEIELQQGMPQLLITFGSIQYRLGNGKMESRQAFVPFSVIEAAFLKP